MRHISAASSISAIIASTVLASGAFAAPKKASDLKSEKDKISYILGHQIGGNFKKNSIELNSEIFAAAVNEALAGKTSVISTEDTQKINEISKSHDGGPPVQSSTRRNLRIDLARNVSIRMLNTPSPCNPPSLWSASGLVFPLC